MAALGPRPPCPEGPGWASVGRGPLGPRLRVLPWLEGRGVRRPPHPSGTGPRQTGTSPVLSLFSFQIIGISLSRFNIWMFLFKRSGEDLLWCGVVPLSPAPRSARPWRRRPLASPGGGAPAASPRGSPLPPAAQRFISIFIFVLLSSWYKLLRRDPMWWPWLFRRVPCARPVPTATT